MKYSPVAWASLACVVEEYGLSIFTGSKLQAVWLNGLWPLQQHFGNSVGFEEHLSHFYCIWPHGSALSLMSLMTMGFSAYWNGCLTGLLLWKLPWNIHSHSWAHHSLVPYTTLLLQHRCEKWLWSYLKGSSDKIMMWWAEVPFAFSIGVSVSSGGEIQNTEKYQSVRVWCTLNNLRWSFAAFHYVPQCPGAALTP